MTPLMNPFAYDGGTDSADYEPVVLVHGAGLDHTVWRYQSRYLAHHGMSVRAVDLPGHGRTPGPPLRTVEDLADWLITRWIAPAKHRVHLVGHSLGALVALEATARSPHMIDRLVLMNSGPAMRVHPQLQEAADRGQGRAVDLIIGWSYGGRGRLGGHPDPGMWQTGVARRMFERGLRTTLGIDLAATATYERGPEAAAAISCPVLVLAGHEDRMVPERAARQLAGLLANATLTVVERAGHMLPLEAPEATRRLLGAFLPLA